MRSEDANPDKDNNGGEDERKESAEGDDEVGDAASEAVRGSEAVLRPACPQLRGGFQVLAPQTVVLVFFVHKAA